MQWKTIIAWKDVISKVLEDGRLITEDEGEVGKIFDNVMSKRFGDFFKPNDAVKIVLKATKDTAYLEKMMKDKVRCWKDGNSVFSVGAVRVTEGNCMELEELEELKKHPFLAQFAWKERAFISHTKYLAGCPFDIGDIVLLKVERL